MASAKLWGGRFQGMQDKAAEAFMRSFDVDRVLFFQDLRVLKAHVEMLRGQKILPVKKAARILRALEQIAEDVGSGHLKLEGDHEDIHSFLENALARKVGGDASLIRVGRSRNDTVVTDVRLYVKEALAEIRKAHAGYVKALIDLAERFQDAVVPAYTHLRRAQPVLFSFYCLAHVSAGMRERELLELAYRLADVCTLGAGAVSGSSWALDPSLTARRLGFSASFFNALDATSDRDFLLATHFAGSVIMTHLSRLSEDLILWSSEGFEYVDLPDALCTGSSLMPQKKNPDPLELVRGKTGRVLGNFLSLFVLLKGLPMGYNRDLQEDKEPLFETLRTVRQALEIMARILGALTLRKARLAEIWQDDFSLATDLADELVKKGYPFALAHEAVGKAVRYCTEKGKPLGKLTIPELSTLMPGLDGETLRILSPEESARRRESPGGTGTKAVRQALAQARRWLKSLEDRPH